MNYFDGFLQDVEDGLAGRNYGLSTGSAKLDGLIGGVQRGTYYLIGGNTGTGKTAFADFAFVLSPYKNYLHNVISSNYREGPLIKYRVFYYSQEIAAKRKIAKWVCLLMFERHQIIIDINEVYSRRSQLSEEKYEMIKMCRDYIEKMMDWVHIFDRPINPYGIYKEVSEYMERNGTTKEIIKNVRGQDLKFKTYIPNDSYEIVVVIVDHIGLLRPETIRNDKGEITASYRNKKEIIDHDSENAITLRNLYGVSRVSISQFNRDLADMDRRRFTELTPQLEDFKNTGNASEDAEVVMTLFNPLRYGETTYAGLNVVSLQGRYRPLSILKSRDTSDMKTLNLNFLGECGHFRDFPNTMSEHNYREAREYTRFT
ncbi:MAG: DnaB-like helicase C-terminal domain-containing protein [Planctomycetota bacterium]|jgi:hypothetical protein